MCAFETRVCSTSDLGVSDKVPKMSIALQTGKSIGPCGRLKIDYFNRGARLRQGAGKTNASPSSLRRAHPNVVDVSFSNRSPLEKEVDHVNHVFTQHPEWRT